MSRSRITAAALLGAAFLVGALAGGVAVSMLDAREAPRSGRGGGGRQGHLARLTAELALTPAQQDSVQAVYDRSQPLMDSLWREIRPQFDAQREAIRGEVRRLLTSDQQEKYRLMIERQESEFRQGRGRNERK